MNWRQIVICSVAVQALIDKNKDYNKKKGVCLGFCGDINSMGKVELADLFESCFNPE